MTQINLSGKVGKVLMIMTIISTMNIQYVRLFLLALIVVVCSVSPGWSSNPEAVYQLAVSLFPESQQLEGEARLRISEQQHASGIELRLSPQAELLGVTLDGQPAVFSFSGDSLRINPAPGVGSGSSMLAIHYRVRYADPLPATTVGMENPSFGISATIGEVGTYLSSGTAWFPQPQLAPEHYRIRIEGPSGLYGVTSGKLLDHGIKGGQSYTLWETSFPLDGLALSAGYYQIFKEQIDDIQVLAFLTEQNASLAPAYLDSTKTYLQFYQRLLGPYPYPKFAIVENFLPTGYGLPSWTLLGSNVIALPFIPYTSLPHEIVHSWYGNAVEVDYVSGNWAEGLTSYLADYLLQEQRSEEQGREHRLKLLRDYAALVTPESDYPLSRFVSRTSKRDQAIGYGKAAMIFHMLRHQVGEEAFWATLRSIAEQGAGRRLGWSDLEQFFSAGSGRDLQVFFRQWVELPGAPRVQFEDIAVLDRAGGWEVRGMVMQSEPVFNFSLPLQLTTEAGIIEQSVVITQKQTPFAIRTDTQALQLSGDPGAHLFRRLVTDELPATINDLRASSNLLVVARTVDDPLLQASADLLRGLRKAGAKVVNWREYQPELASQHDLLFIGWPTKGLPPWHGQASWKVGQDGFEWNGTRYDDPLDSLFVCRKSLTAGPHIMAVFLPNSSDAARAVARKIHHYGRYSYLLFKDSANLVKGTNEPGESPLRIDLQ